MNDVISTQHPPIDAYRDIFEEYVESASFLWILRSIAVTEPNYTIDDIAELEKRIEAQLDGLMSSLDLAWKVCELALESVGQSGEVFTATIVAFRSRDSNKIKIAISAGLVNDETFKGVVSALGWLPAHLVAPWITKFFNSKDLDHKYLALAACSVRRDDPGEILNTLFQRDDCINHEKLYARALRLIGELRRQDLMSELNLALSSKNERIVFWATWSSVLLGNNSNLEKLKIYFLTDGPYQDIVIQLVFRVISVEQGRSWISDLVKNKSQIRAVIKAIGVLGDPHAVNWLITIMNEPVYIRLAGEAFTNITGINLDEGDLSIEPPDTIDAIPNDEPDDENVFMDEDESLPWPNRDKITTVWQQYGKKFIVGQRYFLGKKITIELLTNTIKNATQRQRLAAAIELALIDTEHQLVNVHQRVSS